MLLKLLASSAIALAMGAIANPAFALEDSSKKTLRWQANYDAMGRYKGCIAFFEEGKQTSAVWHPVPANDPYHEEACTFFASKGKKKVDLE